VRLKSYLERLENEGVARVKVNIYLEYKFQPETGISMNYSATNLGSPEVELRFCPLFIFSSNIELGGLT